MGNGSNEIKYKLAEMLLKRMREADLLNEEEWERITVLNIQTFLRNLQSISVKHWIYVELCGSVCC